MCGTLRNIVRETVGKINKGIVQNRYTSFSAIDDEEEYVEEKETLLDKIKAWIYTIKTKFHHRLAKWLVEKVGMVDNRWIEEKCKYQTRYISEDSWEIENGELNIYLDAWDGAYIEFNEEQLVGVSKITINHTLACDFTKIYLNHIPEDIELSLWGCYQGGRIYGPRQLKKNGIYVLTILRDLLEVREYDELTILEEPMK